MSLFRDLLVERLGDQYAVSPAAVAQLEAHFDLLQKWNAKMNLTSLRDTEDIVVRHYCEAIALAQCLPEGELRVLDAGSGAGFPGIPIAILRPEAKVLLVESDRRKAVFLREAAGGNIQVSSERLETMEGCVDWLVSRAVAWSAIGGAASRLATHVGLLTSRDGLVEPQRDPRFKWTDPSELPWPSHPIILIGASVSRGTTAT